MTYLYSAPAASLIKTDVLDVSDAASEQARGYVSPDASAPYEITSRYEWGPDLYLTGANGGVLYPRPHQLPNQPDIPMPDEANLLIAFPAHTDTGRKTATYSEFTLRIEPKNFGVMLRRKLDYQYPNQLAKVFIADASSPQSRNGEYDWQPAGIWYLAGANTWVHSCPRRELGETLHNVRTSNRRFREDEFLVPRALTEGRSAIRVRVESTPVERSLFPGHKVEAESSFSAAGNWWSELVWSELRYDAYTYVMPEWSPDAKQPPAGQEPSIPRPR